MSNTTHDFGGYATKINIRCADGRTILKDAFKHQDGATVPLVWSHQHSSPENILGHAKLENRPDGVYCYGKFNDTAAGQNAKQLVAHGDISSLSIYATRLKEHARNVIHGAIREVSLVLSGANPGALIDDFGLSHGDDGYLEEAIIYSGQAVDMAHDEETSNNEALPTTLDSLSLREKEALHSLLASEINGAKTSMRHTDDPTIRDVFESLSEQQKNVVYYMLGAALEGKSAAHSATYIEGDDVMKKNVFEKDNEAGNKHTLTHDDLGEILGKAKQCGSLRDAFLAHADSYGFDPVDILFPEARNLDRRGPQTIKREDSWVAGVLADTSKTPFSRVRTTMADLTAEEARAKGYVTGNKKTEQVIKLMKRVTIPQTVYKKQKLDRDDILDITDFDVIRWIRREMRDMLNEELGRAILVGDGRSAGDDDKIMEDHLRPISTDDEDIFIHLCSVDADTAIDEVIDEVIRARKHYKGSGKPKFYTTAEMVTEMLLVKDLNQRRIYKDAGELASVLRVSELIEVEAMEGAKRGEDEVIGIMVNLRDYTVGADRGGQVSMFDDFDIDYNQHKYLIETRVSGALTRPKFAVVFVRKKSAAALG